MTGSLKRGEKVLKRDDSLFKLGIFVLIDDRGVLGRGEVLSQRYDAVARRGRAVCTVKDGIANVGLGVAIVRIGLFTASDVVAKGDIRVAVVGCTRSSRSDLVARMGGHVLEGGSSLR